MNVLVLGGCADMAVPLLQKLQMDHDVTDVLLADRNETKAALLAETCGPKFHATPCDANNHDNVVHLMQGRDLAFGYVGPFYIFEEKMARCAIEAATPYVSIADDYDAYLAVLRLEESAQQAGVKILTGFGNSPGLTQILARKGYNSVSNPYRINVHWCAGSDESVGPSNLTHLFHIFNGTTLQTLNGQEVPVKTGGGAKQVTFPEPIGTAAVYYTGHAESVSLPRNLPGLTEATLHGGIKPNYIVTLVKLLSALKLFATHKRRVAMARFFHRIEGWFASEGIDKSVGRIDVYGKKDGQTMYQYYTYVGHIAEITSLPAYLAGKWLGAGRFNHLPGGVYAAERLLEDPDEFLQELKNLGLTIKENAV